MSTFKSSSVRIFAAFAAVGIVCLQADATVIDGSVFRYQMSIKPASGMVTTTLANFPVLVRLSAEKLENFVPAQCGENGADIRFALADGTLLAHEIDFWNANGESTVWVNVPSLTNGTEIVAYWSLRNGKTAPAVTASGTWPNFVAVYHFSEATGAIGDSSANHYASTNALATVSNTTAKVGLSRNMAGDRFRTGVTNLLSSSAAKPIATVSKFTVSGWMKETTGVSAGYRTLFNKGASPVGWYQSTQNNLTQMTASGSGTTTSVMSSSRARTVVR